MFNICMTALLTKESNKQTNKKNKNKSANCFLFIVHERVSSCFSLTKLKGILSLIIYM